MAKNHAGGKNQLRAGGPRPEEIEPIEVRNRVP